MKNDSRELQQVQSAAANTGAPRLDMYAGIHKALRALLADTLVAVGRMDAHDALELAQTTQRALQMLDFMGAHLRHENEFLHPALEARAPGTSDVIAYEHEGHEADIAALASEATALLHAPAECRDADALALYRHLSLFTAHNFEHMFGEETAHNAVLWAHYTDAELLAIHDALVASIPPEEMMFVLRWMVPFMTPQERAAMLSGMRAQAPAPAFDAALAVVRPHLREREWDKLAQALELPRGEHGPAPEALQGC